MRPTAIFMLAAALGSITLFAARAGASLVSASHGPIASSRPSAMLPATRRGASPNAACIFLRARPKTAPAVPSTGATTLQSYLYVADQCEPAIDVLRTGTGYAEFGHIYNGLSQPDDAFVDSHGNLLVANFGGENVVTYAPGNWSAPSFTYTANVFSPYAVAADAQGNVYEGDAIGVLNEFYPNQNIAIASCRPINNGDSTAVMGVAVDGHNDVFATVIDTTAGTSELVEYPGGLNSCSGLKVLLSMNTLFFYGIAVDKNANLLLTFEAQNLTSSGVFVVDPPYTALGGLLGGQGFQQAYNVSLSKSNKLAFVTDVIAGTVTVLNYPSGSVVAVLGTAHGISQPWAAVEQPNAVY